MESDPVTSNNPYPDPYPDTVRDDDPAFNTSVAHQARVYNYLLGGKDHFPADREWADAVIALHPEMATAPRVNRDFLGRAVRFLGGEAGLSQFLDIGTGIPGPGSTHEVAQEVRPDSRIVYVDYDPVVLSHARALLVGRPPGTTDYIDADLRQPGRILEQAAGTLDFSKPVGVLLLFILHAIPDEDDPYGIVAALMDALPSGSYLALSHGTMDMLGDSEEEFTDLNREKSRQQYTSRTRAEVTRFFDGLDLVEPGLVRPESWRPDPPGETGDTVSVVWAGVARKPLRKEPGP